MTAEESRPEGRFRARIYRVGILRCVDVPEKVGAAFAEWRHPPVRVELGEGSARTHMTPGGGGRFRLYLDSDLREGAGVDTGDEVEIRIRLDPELQSEPFPDDLLDCASELTGGLQVLETLPPGLKRQVLEFLADAKSASTRAKRLDRIEQLLRERADKQGLRDDL